MNGKTKAFVLYHTAKSPRLRRLISEAASLVGRRITKTPILVVTDEIVATRYRSEVWGHQYIVDTYYFTIEDGKVKILDLTKERERGEDPTLKTTSPIIRFDAINKSVSAIVFASEADAQTLVGKFVKNREAYLLTK